MKTKYIIILLSACLLLVLVVCAGLAGLLGYMFYTSSDGSQVEAETQASREAKDIPERVQSPEFVLSGLGLNDGDHKSVEVWYTNRNGTLIWLVFSPVHPDYSRIKKTFDNHDWQEHGRLPVTYVPKPLGTGHLIKYMDHLRLE